MLNKKVGCAILVLLITALGIYVNIRPAKFPPEAKQRLDEFIEKLEGPDFSYTIVSARQGTLIDFRLTTHSYPRIGVRQRLPGGEAQYDPEHIEIWCVIIDKEVEISPETRCTHFLLQKWGQLWLVYEVPDPEAEDLQLVRCRNW